MEAIQINILRLLGKITVRKEHITLGNSYMQVQNLEKITCFYYEIKTLVQDLFLLNFKLYNTQKVIVRLWIKQSLF